jgi:quercetin dioxygenase-like cupin family protein
MKKHRVGILVVGLLTIGAASAVAQTASPTVVDLGKGKVSGPFSFEAKDTSDMVVHKVVFDAAGAGNTWHTHPPLAVIVKTGSFTVHTGDASGCTSKTYTAGQAVIDPGGVTHVHEASQDVELSVTYVGVPVGAPVAKDAPAPTGPNCPTKLATGLARTELSRSTIQGATRAAATGDSEMLMQFVTVPAKTNFRDSWYSSPAALFASMKSGSLTFFTGNATSCTSQTYTAGQGAFVPADQVIFVRNDGSAPAEVYATRLALPVGAAPRVDAKNPGGANCPDVAAAAQPAQPTGPLPRTGGAAGVLVMLGLGLAGVGTIARALTGRR